MSYIKNKLFDLKKTLKTRKTKKKILLANNRKYVIFNKNKSKIIEEFEIIEE